MKSYDKFPLRDVNEPKLKNVLNRYRIFYKKAISSFSDFEGKLMTSTVLFRRNHLINIIFFKTKKIETF